MDFDLFDFLFNFQGRILFLLVGIIWVIGWFDILDIYYLYIPNPKINNFKHNKKNKYILHNKYKINNK